MVGGDDSELPEGFEMGLDGEEEMVVQGPVYAKGSSDDVQPLQLEYSRPDEVTEKDVLGCFIVLGLSFFIPCCQGRVDFKASETTWMMCQGHQDLGVINAPFEYETVESWQADPAGQTACGASSQSDQDELLDP